jgi:hypothetical protein
MVRRMRRPRLGGITVVAAAIVAAVAAAALAVIDGAAAQLPLAPSGLAPVDLALVLAVDASGSISDDRWDLERQGYAAAFRDPEVVRAIQSGGVGGIAVTLFVWSGAFQQSTVVGWTRVSDAKSAADIADVLALMPHPFKSWTSISAALAYGAERLQIAPYSAPRRVIDVSGDGPDSTSELILQGTRDDVARLRQARDQLVAEGLIINGLPIFGDPRIRSIDAYYESNVIGGPGAFEVVAEDFSAFARAVKRKLILEIAGAARDGQPSLVPVIDE